MKSYYFLIVLLLSGCLLQNGNAQDVSNSVLEQSHRKQNPLEQIDITTHQTTHLVFPAPITYVDLGNSEFFITDYTDNILRIKGRQNHITTNLTIITQDQFYYSFLVRYSVQPQLNYFISSNQSIRHLAKKEQRTLSSLTHNKEAPTLSDKPKVIPINQNPIHQNPTHRKKGINTSPLSEQKEQLIQRTAQKIIKENPSYRFIKSRHDDIHLKVLGIYHSLDHCYIQYEIQNKGAIPYDISYTEFGIREKRRPKRTAINEQILTPIFLLRGEQTRVLPNETNRYVAVFEKLAVPKHRLCYMEVIEAGRNLDLIIPFQRIKIKKIRE